MGETAAKTGNLARKRLLPLLLVISALACIVSAVIFNSQKEGTKVYPDSSTVTSMDKELNLYEYDWGGNYTDYIKQPINGMALFVGFDPDGYSVVTQRGEINSGDLSHIRKEKQNV